MQPCQTLVLENTIWYHEPVLDLPVHHEAMASECEGVYSDECHDASFAMYHSKVTSIIQM